MQLVQGNFYGRTRLVARSTCKTRLVTHSTWLTTRSTRSTRPLVVLVSPLVVLVFSTGGTRLSIRLFIPSTPLSTGSICLSKRSTRSTICRSFYN